MMMPRNIYMIAQPIVYLAIEVVHRVEGFAYTLYCLVAVLSCGEFGWWRISG